MAIVHLVRPLERDAPDSVVVKAARLNEPWAQELLFRRHSGLVYGLAFRLAGPNDARDITQDAFVLAFQSLASLRDPQALRSWLCGITVRLARRRRRWLGRFNRIFRPDNETADAISAYVSPDIAVELRQVYAHVERLPEKFRTAFLLRRVEGMKVEDIALAMDTSAASVKRWVKSAEDRIEKASYSVRQEVVR